MIIDDLEIKKDGYITIDSIFGFDSPLDITLLIDRCRRIGCTLRFENEDLTIDDSYSNDTVKLATITLYQLLAGYPKAAQDYYNYLFKKANNKEAPGD